MEDRNNPERAYHGIFIHANLFENGQLNFTEACLLSFIRLYDVDDGCQLSSENLAEMLNISSFSIDSMIDHLINLELVYLNTSSETRALKVNEHNFCRLAYNF